MATSHMLDANLIRQTMELGNDPAKRETDNEARRAYIALLKEERILVMVGLVELDPR